MKSRHVEAMLKEDSAQERIENQPWIRSEIRSEIKIQHSIKEKVSTHSHFKWPAKIFLVLHSKTHYLKVA